MRDREELYSGVLALTALISLLILSPSTASATQSNQSNLTITRITNSGLATSPAIYGDRIAWMGNPYDIVNYNIYIYDFSTKKETQITTSGTAFDLVIYGDTIVWQDRKPKGEYSETDNIYTCNLNSTLTPVAEASESGISGKAPMMELLNLSQK